MEAVSRFAPPLALMGLIFYLSAQPDLGTDLGSIDLILRKGAHMTVFGALWLLSLRAVGWRAPVAAAVFTLAYAISDELHQSTVDGRHGTPVDVAIDMAGVAVTALLRRAWLDRRRSRAQASSGT